MEPESKSIPINPLVQDFYRMAEEYDGIDTEDINPSLNDLSQVTQRYQSAELIAEGGMKRIYRVYDARAKRHLALAMLREDAPEDLCDPFIHEAWLTARLDHPNIITIHDVGVKEGKQPYFTMDLKQGQTLRGLIENLHAGDRKTRAKYPLETLLQIFLKICDAVSYAHSVNVLHLDLKPANIQIGEYGRVLVCDWGLGCVLGGDNPQELDRMLFNPDLLGSSNLYGQFKGTPGYMAPERLEDDGKVDARTDVYGLGCILYSMLTFLRTLTGDEEEIIKRTKDGAIVPPIERAPEQDIPMALNAVAMKALATDPARRYASVDTLRDEVHRYLTGFATEAENAGVFKQLNLFYRRNRRFCLTVLCSLLVIVVGTVFGFIKISEKERMATEARQDAERTLALYEAGQTELEKVNAESIDSIILLAQRYQNQGNVDRALAILETALGEHPGDEKLSRTLGEVLMARQRFRAALPWFAQGIHPEDPVHDLVRDYAAMKPDDEKLTADQVVDVIHRLGNRQGPAFAVVLEDQKNRFDLEERARIIEAYLHGINPLWTDGWFEYDAEKSRLRLGGSGLNIISSEKNLFVALKLRELDISGSDIEALWAQKELPVERLDIRGTPMKIIWPIKQLVHLRELVITPGQMSAEELKKLPEQVKVIERPYP
ncbi:protein kinase domain-containing protein [Pontiella sulfatireligans]|uniref:Serine/threonine-protein kinase PknD n=1 Tax=Pontiella sulfatireligans TaxID=2750658 RepID=A0A6C2URD9_9BACT|nr:protein kinase [Pontiella sulfatireligans]VGO22892.1 Serine/threonine-protein kinase PknD [Pontiella sulfatireligans]